MEQILDQVDSKTEYTYGGFWERFVASFIDGIVLMFAQNVLSFAIYQESAFGSTNLDISGYSFLLGVAYHVYFISSEKQATWGKQAMGLKVIGLKGERITPINAVGRYFASILSAIILGIGYLMVAFDAKKQGLHDKLAGTYVVKA